MPYRSNLRAPRKGKRELVRPGTVAEFFIRSVPGSKSRASYASRSRSGRFALTAAFHFHELVVVLLRAHRVGHRE
jgi:hypothetical protein